MSEYMKVIDISEFKTKYIESFVNTTLIYFKQSLTAGSNHLLPISFVSSKNNISSFKISGDYIYSSDLSKPAYDTFSSSLNKYIKNGFFVLDFSKIRSLKCVSDVVSFLLLNLCKQAHNIKEEIINYKKKIKPARHNKNVRFSTKMYINATLPRPLNSITATGRLKSILKKKK